MAIHTYTYNDSYTIKGSSQMISVSVILGNGHGGSYMIFKNQVLIATNTMANFGDGDNSDGKYLQIVAVIQDKLVQTNWTSVTVEINENGETRSYPFSRELPNDLDIANYNITILMKK